MKTLKVQQLTEESFKPYGQIVSKDIKPEDAGDDNFSWWDGLSYFGEIGKISVNILEAKKRSLVIDKIEEHKATPELVVPMNGDGVVFVVAEKGKLNEDTLAAFYLAPGKGVMMDTGVRHFIPYPVKENVDCLIVFKDATGANDLIFEELSDSYELDTSAVL